MKLCAVVQGIWNSGSSLLTYPGASRGMVMMNLMVPWKSRKSGALNASMATGGNGTGSADLGGPRLMAATISCNWVTRSTGQSASGIPMQALENSEIRLLMASPNAF